jgi:Cys-Gly metallodipeptidase DUG1
VSYFKLQVEGPGKDLHSGVFGGTVHEPMTDLIYLMSSLVKPDGTILIPGINDDVAPLNAKETALYEDLAFQMTDLHDAIGSLTSIYPDEKNSLMHRYFEYLNGTNVDGVTLLYPFTGSKALFPPQALKPSSPPV